MGKNNEQQSILEVLWQARGRWLGPVLRPAFAGWLLGLGASINLAIGSEIGALASTIGLLVVWSESLPLAAANATTPWRRLIGASLGNASGAWLAALLFAASGFVTPEFQLDSCREYLTSQTAFETAAKAFYCGVLLSFLRAATSPGAIFARVVAVGWILNFCGLNYFVTDVFYWSVGGGSLGEAFRGISLAFLGNVLGAFVATKILKR